MTEKVISATQARMHFGELIQKVVNEQSPVVVECGGKAQVVIISVDQYEQLKRLQEQRTDWRASYDLSLNYNEPPPPPPLTATEQAG